VLVKVDVADVEVDVADVVLGVEVNVTEEEVCDVRV